MKQKVYAICFSGGKDSMLALDRAIRNGLNVQYMVNIYDIGTERVRFHGFKKELLQKQADALGLELIQSGSTGENFEQIFMEGLQTLKEKGVDGVIFGDIHLRDVKGWFEERTTSMGFEHMEPLWLVPPLELVSEVVDRGYQITITSLDLEKTDPSWLGKQITPELIQEFIAQGIDPCGENGEYHSFVSDGPLFKKPIHLHLGEVHKTSTHVVVDVVMD